MSTDATQTPATGTTAAPTNQQAGAAHSPPITPPAPDLNQEPTTEPPWLKSRLARAGKAASEETRKAILAEFGVEDPTVVKKLLEEQKKKADEQKTLEQRLAEADVERKVREERIKTLEAATNAMAGEQMAALTDEQRTAVTKLAGSDPAKQIDAIAALRPTWVTHPAQAAAATTTTAAQTTAAPAAAVTKPPATTTPAPNAPPLAETTVTPNHLAVYEEMKKTQPIRAGFFYATYHREIAAARAARGG